MSRTEYIEEVVDYYRRQTLTPRRRQALTPRAWHDLERLLMLVMDRDDVRLDPQAKRLSEAVEKRIFGKRKKCPKCRSDVLPGQLCWGCHGWTAK